jgi:hypothetical protein
MANEALDPRCCVNAAKTTATSANAPCAGRSCAIRMVTGIDDAPVPRGARRKDRKPPAARGGNFFEKKFPPWTPLQKTSARFATALGSQHSQPNHLNFRPVFPGATRREKPPGSGGPGEMISPGGVRGGSPGWSGRRSRVTGAAAQGGEVMHTLVLVRHGREPVEPGEPVHGWTDVGLSAGASRGQKRGGGPGQGGLRLRRMPDVRCSKGR